MSVKASASRTQCCSPRKYVLVSFLFPCEVQSTGSLWSVRSLAMSALAQAWLAGCLFFGAIQCPLAHRGLCMYNQQQVLSQPLVFFFLSLVGNSTQNCVCADLKLSTGKVQFLVIFFFLLEMLTQINQSILWAVLEFSEGIRWKHYFEFDLTLIYRCMVINCALKISLSVGRNTFCISFQSQTHKDFWGRKTLFLLYNRNEKDLSLSLCLLMDVLNPQKAF